MSDFMLEPNEIESERPERGRPVRMVSTGLAPTAAVPPSVRRGKEPVPCYAPCEACGAPVLTGSTPIGIRLALDTQHPTYIVTWPPGAPEPTLYESRGYLQHHCGLVSVMEV